MQNHAKKCTFEEFWATGLWSNPLLIYGAENFWWVSVTSPSASRRRQRRVNVGVTSPSASRHRRQTVRASDHHSQSVRASGRQHVSASGHHELDALRLILRCLIFTCAATWTWCSAAWSSFPFLHEFDAPLLDLHLHFYMNLMLRCLIFTCILHEFDAPLPDLHLHHYMNLMLRCLFFICISTWTWCSAPWSSLAVLHELDALLLDLHLHFYMSWMLRCLIFISFSTWTWCSAAWSSLAFLYELDAPLLDLHLHFLYEIDAPLLDLHLHVYMNLMPRCLIFTCMSRTSLRSVRVHVRASDRHRQSGAVGQSPLDIH